MDFQEGIFILNSGNAAVNNPAVAMYVCAIIATQLSFSKHPMWMLKNLSH
jgi:hypothetical protein